MIDYEMMVDTWETHLRENARLPCDPFWREVWEEWKAFKSDWEEYIYS